MRFIARKLRALADRIDGGQHVDADSFGVGLSESDTDGVFIVLQKGSCWIHCRMTTNEARAVGKALHEAAYDADEFGGVPHE